MNQHVDLIEKIQLEVIKQELSYDDINPLTSQLQFLVLLSLTECNSMKPVEFFHKNSYPTIFEGALSESVEKILEFFHFP